MNLLRVITTLLALWLTPALAANQAPFQTPTTGPMSASTFTTLYLNPGLLALATCNWGPTAPANGPGFVPSQFQCWMDTSASPSMSLRFYDGSQWPALATLNTSTHVWSTLIVGSSGISGGSSGAPLFNNGGVLGNGLVSSTWTTFLQFGTGATSRTVQAKARDTFSVLDFVDAGGGHCVPDNITDCAPAIQACVNAAYDYSQSAPITPSFSGGKCYLPAAPSNYRTAATISMPRNIGLLGDGGNASCISADNVDAIRFSFTSGGGNPAINGVCIVGVNATAARVGIKRLGLTPLNSDDSMAGLTIRDVTIENFDTAIDLLSVLIFSIENTKIRNVNQGIALRGFTGNASITSTKILKIGGGGTGAVTNTGLDFIPFTYTSGSTPGLVGPEGVIINNGTQVNGFAIGINIQQANWMSITNTNVVASQYGIIFTTVQDGLTISSNDIEMQTSSAIAGIYGASPAITLSTVTNIKNNVIITNGTTTASNGILINSPGTTKQNNVSIESNMIRNMQGYDIALYNPGGANRIAANRLQSTGNTGSMIIGQVQSILTVVEGNTAQNTITNTVASDVTDGFIRFCNNYTSGSIDKACNWNVTTNNTTSGRLMIGGGPGVQPTAAAAGTTTTVYHGNAAGAGAFGAVVSADMNITATNCTNQVVVAISTGGVGTCSAVLNQMDARGVWTSGASWTLPAHSISGTLTGNNQFIQGIGTLGVVNASPKTFIDLNNNLVTSPALVLATSLSRYQAADGSFGGSEWVSYGASPGNVMAGAVAGGSAASPTAAPGSKNMFNLRGYGWDGSAWAIGGIVNIRTSNAWTGSNHGSAVDFYTTPNATTGLAIAGSFATRGGLVIGSSTADVGPATLLLTPQTFATLGTCGAGVEGALAAVTDANTGTWGATITAGGGTNHVMAYCNATNWTVP